MRLPSVLHLRHEWEFVTTQSGRRLSRRCVHCGKYKLAADALGRAWRDNAQRNGTHTW